MDLGALFGGLGAPVGTAPTGTAPGSSSGSIWIWIIILAIIFLFGNFGLGSYAYFNYGGYPRYGTGYGCGPGYGGFFGLGGSWWIWLIIILIFIIPLFRR
jgi:hypothetical protein